MKRLSEAEQLVVLDTVLSTLAKLRDHAAENGDISAARRLDDEHTAVDESKQKLLWAVDADAQKAYTALGRALHVAAKAAPKKSAAKKSKRPQRASSAGKRAR